MRNHLPALSLLAACGGSSATTADTVVAPPSIGPLSGVPVRSSPGERACTEECFDAHARACTSAWEIRYGGVLAPMGSLYVSDLGMARLEQGGSRMYSVDGDLWLVCSPRCGGVENVCFPVRFAFSAYTFDDVDDCTYPTTPGEPWNDRETVWATITCREKEIGRLRYVPELVAVRDALLTGDLLDSDQEPVMLDGLLISMDLGGTRMDMVADVVPASCADLALPVGYELHASRDDYERARETSKAAWTSTQATPDATNFLEAVEEPICSEYVGR